MGEVGKRCSSGLLRFEGQFTPGVRQELRNKRLTLGITQERLAWLLKTNWSTLRKWEAGQTTACHDRYIPRINDFLDGAYDESLHSMRELESILQLLWGALSHDFQTCLERLINLHTLCQHYPSLCDCVVQKLRTCIAQIIDQLMQITFLEEDLSQDKPLPPPGP